LLNLLGNASYSIYLTHGVVSLRIVERLLRHVPLHGWIQFIAWMSGSLLLSAVVGIVVYEFFERPVLRWLRSVWAQPVQRSLHR
jgi:peptidoglycan/LPS O-acetylase OafA/YrhL